MLRKNKLNPDDEVIIVTYKPQWRMIIDIEYAVNQEDLGWKVSELENYDHSQFIKVRTCKSKLLKELYQGDDSEREQEE